MTSVLNVCATSLFPYGAFTKYSDSKTMARSIKNGKNVNVKIHGAARNHQVLCFAQETLAPTKKCSKMPPLNTKCVDH